MKKTWILAVVAMLITVPALAAEKQVHLENGKVTKKVAVATAKLALETIKTKGEKAAYDLFSDPNGPFIEGDLYPFVIDFNGEELAHFKLRGKNVMQLTDKAGVAFVSEFIKVAKTKGSGWVKYLWPKPNETKPSQKYTYVEKIPGKDAMVLVGTYDMTDAEMAAEMK